MKKNRLFDCYQSLKRITCCLALVLCYSTLVFAQNPKISILAKDISIKELLNQIEEKIDYSFAYATGVFDSNTKVSVDAKNEDVKDILLSVIPNIEIQFDGKKIIILAENNAPQTIITVKGIVLDEAGLPLIGASIAAKGSNNWATTDALGEFTIKVPSDATLSAIYLGYVTQEIQVSGRKNLSITLGEDHSLIEELVVTALGIKREEKALGYATQKIVGNTLSTVKNTDIATSLTGKIAGLNVLNSTEFNTAPTIKLRGETPLLVVDGVPYGNISLRDIAADDVESIDVLKGATASALYGSRGGAGAIMVTTKKGGKEGLNIQINSSTMFNVGYLVLPEVQSSYSQGGAGKYVAGAEFVWGDKMDIGRKAVQYDPYTYEWREMELVSKGKDNFKNFLEPGLVTNNNISITQQGKYGSFRTSLTHVYNKGQYPNQKLNKITYSVSGQMKLNKLNIEAGAIYNKRFYPNDQGAGYGGGGYIYNLLVWTGTEYDVRDYRDYWVRGKEHEKQNWMYGVWYDNPYFLAHEQTRSNNYDKINTYLSGRYDIFPWLNLSIRSGIDAYMSRTETKNPPSSNGGWNKKGYFEVEKGTGFSMNNDALLSADHSFGDFTVDGFVGGTLYYYNDEYSGAETRNGLSIPGYYSLKASVDPIRASSTYRSKQVNSLYGGIAFSWKDAVFIDATARNDWSSTLPEETRSYFYPSVSGSVILSEFFNTPSWLDFWKIRGSWTLTKTDLDVYEINKAYSINTNVWDGLNTATYPTSMRSSTLQPTASKAFEVGTGFNILDNRLRFDITYYNKLRYNLTREATISDASGFEDTLINYDEELLRQGVEVSMGASIIRTANWNWDVSANWTRDRYTYSKIDDIYSTQKPWVAAGERWDWYGIYDWERDPSGNIVHEAGMPVKSDYQSVMGNEYPDWIWGLSTTLRYKNWTLNVAFDGRVGGMAYSRTEQTMWNTGVHADSDNQWRYNEVVNGNANYVGPGVKIVSGSVEYNTHGGIINDTRVFAPNDQEVSYEAYTRKYNPWSGGKVYQNVFDCTFFKLRELSLGYTLPKSISDKLRLNETSISFVGQNLFIWMKEFKNADPDIDSDDMSSPSMRYIGFNVKLNF